MSKFITNIVDQFEVKTPSLQNQHDRISFIGVLPIQANANYNKADKNNPESYWAQLLVNFSSAYQRIDESGVVSDDNKSLKTLVISFPKKYLDDNQISISQFTIFFEREYVAKKFLILPVTEEKQAFQVQGDKKIPIKNQTKVSIDSNFDLKAFIDSHKEVKK
jgi:hypothetical protein